jgi:bifunctional non-homologous end joining protein LigD
MSQRKQLRRAALPKAFAPQLAVLVAHPPSGDGWFHEIKFDGYRLLAFAQRGRVRLVTRRGHDWTDAFPSIAKALKGLKVDTAIIDGEVVALDKRGRSDFQLLQASMKGAEDFEPVYYAFDMPFCDGVDLTRLPLVERKERLKKVLAASGLAPQITYSAHVGTSSAKLLAGACKRGLEGIISKRANAPYVSGRDESWVKSKCEQRQEFVIIGYTAPQGSRTGFGALLLGYHEEARLVYAGRVGTGFNVRLLDELHARLRKMEVKAPPTATLPPARERRLARWVTPKLVAEIRFTGWTRDGMLRHPTFIALRSDKPATDVVRERARA